MWRRSRGVPIGWCLGALFWVPAGCTSVVPEALRSQLDRSVTYAQLSHDPESYRGRLVLVGGEVTRADFAGRDLALTLADRPISPMDESPTLGAASRGDLVVRVPNGARAAIREGNVVTVVGIVLGREAAADPTSAPYLEARHIYVWPVAPLQPPAPEPRW